MGEALRYAITRDAHERPWLLETPYTVYRGGWPGADPLNHIHNVWVGQAITRRGARRIIKRDKARRAPEVVQLDS